MSGHRPSKGKARATEADLNQAFASFTVSDPDPHTPRTGYYDQSYPSTYGESYDSPYTGDSQNYDWTAQGSQAPTQSPQSTYGSSGAYNAFPTTYATSSTGGYEYQNDLSGTPAYSGYSAYDGASVTSSSAASYNAGGSGSVWSGTQSHTTGASSAPSNLSHQTDVNNTIHRQAVPNQRYELPCELRNVTGCNVVFPGDDEHGWMDHVESHLGGTFPSKLRCWFCNDHYFDARQTAGGDFRYNFTSRMSHIRHHIVYEGFRPEQMLTDGHVVQHLFDKKLIDRRTYDSILTPNRLPPLPSDQGDQGSQGSQGNQSQQGHHGHHRSHRSHHGHHSHHSHLPRVVEDVAGEGSSRSNRSSDQQSDRHRSGRRRRDHERSHGSSHRR